MATVVGCRFADGVVLAGDRQVSQNGMIRSTTVNRIQRLPHACIGSADRPNRFQPLVTDLESAIRSYQFRTDESPTCSAITRLAQSISGTHRSAILLACRELTGQAALFIIDDGSQTQEPAAALGTGSALAYGVLEQIDYSQGVDDGEAELSALIKTVSERDSNTGSTVDTIVLRDD